MKSTFRLLPHIRLELLVMIQNILPLIAMTGQDIRNQRLRLWHDERIFILSPLYLIKIRPKDLFSILFSKTLIQILCRQYDPVIELLNQLTHFSHMIIAICTTDKPAMRLQYPSYFLADFRNILTIEQYMIRYHKIKWICIIWYSFRVKYTELESDIICSNRTPCIS